MYLPIDTQLTILLAHTCGSNYWS